MLNVTLGSNINPNINPNINKKNISMQNQKINSSPKNNYQPNFGSNPIKLILGKEKGCLGTLLFVCTLIGINGGIFLNLDHKAQIKEAEANELARMEAVAKMNLDLNNKTLEPGMIAQVNSIADENGNDINKVQKVIIDQDNKLQVQFQDSIVRFNNIKSFENPERAKYDFNTGIYYNCAGYEFDATYMKKDAPNQVIKGKLQMTDINKGVLSINNKEYNMAIGEEEVTFTDTTGKTYKVKLDNPIPKQELKKAGVVEVIGVSILLAIAELFLLGVIAAGVSCDL